MALDLGVDDHAFWTMDPVFFLEIVRERANQAQIAAEARRRMLESEGL